MFSHFGNKQILVLTAIGRAYVGSIISYEDNFVRLRDCRLILCLNQDLDTFDLSVNGFSEDQCWQLSTTVPDVVVFNAVEAIALSEKAANSVKIFQTWNKAV
jgi:hypothetical protein